MPGISAAYEYEVARQRQQRKQPPDKPLTGGAAAERLAIPVGWAHLRASDNPRLAVICELGPRMPTPTGGYSGIEATERPKRTSLTSWQGFEPFAIEADLVIDDTDAGRSVEPVCEALEALAGRGRRATGGQPPHVIVDTAGVMPHDAVSDPDTRWWISELAWSDDEDDVQTNHAGNRILATATVTLLQVVTDKRFDDRALRARQALEKRHAARRTHTVKRGETLVTIARDELGDPGRWDDIGKLNGIRDPRGVKVGAPIKLP